MSVDGTPPRSPHGRRTAPDHVREAVVALGDHRGQVLAHREKAWVSITFAGTRHTLTIMFSGHEGVEAGERFVAELPDHEFTIRGQVVADASVTYTDHRLLPSPRLLVECELLLVEEA